MALRAMAASLASRALTMSRGVAPAAVCRAAALATPSRVSVCGAFTPSMAGSRMQLAGRCFATDGPALHMADILKQELEFELGDYAPPAEPGSPILSKPYKDSSVAIPSTNESLRSTHLAQELEGGPPAPWKLHEEEGDTLLTLTRQYENEHIQVFVSGEDQVDDEEQQTFEDDDGEVDVAVDVGTVFNVSIVKGDESFVFECRSDGSYLQITHVGLEPAEEEVSESSYTGPIYDELDEELQKAFEEYLRERGIDEKLGEYLMAAINDKEQREYVSWLGRVQNFVAI